MNYLDLYHKPFAELPRCCVTCKHLLVDDGDEKLSTCNLDIRLPVKKGSCARYSGDVKNQQAKARGENHA